MSQHFIGKSLPLDVYQARQGQFSLAWQTPLGVLPPWLPLKAAHALQSECWQQGYWLQILQIMCCCQPGVEQLTVSARLLAAGQEL